MSTRPQDPPDGLYGEAQPQPRATRYAITNVERTGYLLEVRDTDALFTINAEGALTFDSAMEASMFILNNREKLPDSLTWVPV